MTIRSGRFGQAGILAGAALLGIGVGVGAAAADPGSSHTDNGRHLGQTGAVSPAAAAAPAHHPAGHANAHANAHASAPKPAKSHRGGHPANQGGTTNQGGTAQPSAVTADPPGNNGTVKIARVGDLDRIPNNTAHPGCAFEVQWYGFDGGSDVVSHVSFTPQAPTSDVSIAVNGPTDVPVGGDAASGAGTASGLDAVQTYTLAFSGGAPAKQGYHVRLTVATPHSLGNDTKTKVFWVEPCESATTAPEASPAAEASTVPLAQAALPLAPAAVVGSASPDASTAPMAEASDAAVPLAADRPVSDAAASKGVPTVIDAGEHHSLLRRVASSPWAGGLVALGIVAALSGVLVGARRRA